MSKASSWNHKIRKHRWKSYKKELLARGFVEVAENTLVVASQARDYPPYVPTHLGGKAERGRNIKIEKYPSGLPPRGIMRQIKKLARREGSTVRQYMARQGSNFE
jgi:hypothetical protein